MGSPHAHAKPSALIRLFTTAVPPSAREIYVSVRVSTRLCARCAWAGASLLRCVGSSPRVSRAPRRRGDVQVYADASHCISPSPRLDVG